MLQVTYEGMGIVWRNPDIVTAPVGPVRVHKFMIAQDGTTMYWRWPIGEYWHNCVELHLTPGGKNVA